ncbi:hypothetical protein FSARC_9110 [Fusarium sarcochroum]|uniref:BTB domain-containing protein n=1 Tax=Fusarium sarcochroum TaxID=1208366 RepID=A0A8H4TRR5_9HYPO|nr:hypothetical protein FSARC_9110 [Fusarium sarcochroum]
MKESVYGFSRDGDTVLVLHTYRSHPFQWTDDDLHYLDENETLDDNTHLENKKKKEAQKRRSAHGDPPPPPQPREIGTDNEPFEDTHTTPDVPAVGDVSPGDQGPAIEEGATVLVPTDQWPVETPDGRASPRLHAATEGSEHRDNRKIVDYIASQKTAATIGEILGAVKGQKCYRMLVSSSHLSQVSPVFHQMLKGPFSESITDKDGFYRITASGWDPHALTVVFDIIHGHNRSVPRQLPLEMLAKVAVIVDYYDCLEAVETFAEIWVNAMAKSQSDVYGKDSMLWLLVSWVFRHRAIFEKMARLAIMHSKRLIMVDDLPIPLSILNAAKNEVSHRIPKTILTGLYDQEGTRDTMKPYV